VWSEELTPLGFGWSFIHNTRRFPAVGSREFNDLDESGQVGRVEPCLCIAGHMGHRLCIPGRCRFGSCRACPIGCRPSPSMTRLKLQAGMGPFASMLGAHAGQNRVGHVPAHLS
jgi:hypothetical protein